MTDTLMTETKVKTKRKEEVKPEVKQRNFKEEVLANGCQLCRQKTFITLDDGALFCEKCRRTYWENAVEARYSVYSIDPFTNHKLNLSN